METIGASIICSKNEPFIHLTLESLVGVVDEVVIVGDPNHETLKLINLAEKFRDYNVMLIWRDWNGNYGDARQKCIDMLETDWILQIDADEVLGDNGYLLKEYVKKGIDVFDFKYEHFIWNLGWLDSTVEEHYGINRFFFNKNVKYKKQLHEFAESDSWKKKDKISDIIIWHLGYIKGINEVRNKFHMNMNNPNRVHDKEFLIQWNESHVLGTYKVKKFEGEYPASIKRWFNL